ncbi:hypothetical protein AB4099_27220 [Bosea sp. 2KB_26]
MGDVIVIPEGSLVKQGQDHTLPLRKKRLTALISAVRGGDNDAMAFRRGEAHGRQVGERRCPHLIERLHQPRNPGLLERVGHDEFCGQSFDKSVSLRTITAVAGGAAQVPDGHYSF